MTGKMVQKVSYIDDKIADVSREWSC